MTISPRLALFALLALMQSPNLTPAERALAAYIDAHNAESLALLERVVNINSGTQNFDGRQGSRPRVR